MLKKFTFLLIMALNMVFCYQSFSMPAKPGLIEFTQPDGSKINIYLYGDEKVKWATTQDGYTLLFNAEGYYEYAVLDYRSSLVTSGVIARNQEDRDLLSQSFLAGVNKNLTYSPDQVSTLKQIWNIYDAEAKNGSKAFPTTGNRKLVCILIGFTDKAFVKTQAEFNDLFNQVGYIAGGATGSIKDYYLENSWNQFNLTVDVKGPFTASNNMAYYGTNVSGNDIRPRELVTEAVTLADPTTNYADYDNDNNGSVDAVYVIYAGYGEESGAPSTTIWAHAWAIPTVTKDGKTISSYSCSSELRGTSGTNITRIGVICHEFGHTLGADDFYDTDYGTGGQYDGTGEWDLMGGGGWNNGGATPSHHNPFTKIYVYGWASAITLSAAQNVAVLNSVQNSNSFYKYRTTTTNEFFLIENRQQIGFDLSLPGHGMLIYHVDSSYISANPYDINADAHQGMYPMAANSTTATGIMTSTSTIGTSGCPWPGTSSKTSFTDATTPNSKSWANANTAKPITNITESSGVIQFCFITCPPACTPPTTQATSYSASAIGDNQMQVNWTRGNGTSVIVVARQGSSVDANPVNGVNYTANAAFGSGTELGTGNFVVYKGTANNVVVTGLQAGTQYYYSIYEFFTADNCFKIPALTGNSQTTGIPPCNICYSWGHTDFATSTTLVNFNTINNVSAKPVDVNANAYSDYSAISTSLNIGSSYNLTVNINTDGNYKAAAMAWIDWNDNCSFDDPGEAYELGYATNQTNGPANLCPLSIQVPLTAVPGTTRMRVTTMYNDPGVTVYPTSCATDIDGEVEDYTIVINPVVGATILTNVTSLSFGNVEIGTSSELSYQVAGYNLTNNLVINAPTDFQISPTSGSGYTSSLILTPASGSVGPLDIYVKFEPQTAQTYTSTLANTSTGATTKNITLNGVGGNFTPIADFSGTPTTVLGGNSVTFTDISTGTPATSWLWTFEGGTPATSTDQNPVITYNTPGVYDVTLAATNASGTDTKSVVDYITVVDPNTCFCDYIDHVPGSPVYYTVTGGYLSGNNGYKDKAKAEYFDNTTGYNSLEGAYFGFAKAYVNNNSTMITINVYDDNGAAASGFSYSPGTVLATKTISLKSIAEDIAAGELTWVDFGAPVNVTGTNFFIGFNIPNPAVAGDTLVILTGQQNAGTNEGWEQSELNAWTAYSTGWGSTFNNAIYPILCATGMPNTDFYASETTVSAGTTVSFTDASTCVPTSWSWSFPGGTPATSAVQNPNIVYSTPGVYNVSLTATNASGSDTYTQTGYITVLGTAVTIVTWNFPLATDNAASDGGIAANNGTRNISVVGGPAAPTYATAGATTRCASSTGWDAGNGTKYWQVSFTTTGYQILKLSSKIAGNNNASPRDFKVQYSLNGTTWVEVPYSNITAVNGTWNTTGSIANINLPTACNNQTLVYLRWIMRSNVSCNGGAITAARASLIDDIIVTGVPIPVAPVANFSASSTSVCASQTVTFTDLSTNIPTSWAWTFTGGTPATSTLQSPTVTYATPGSYNVSLTATNSGGSDVETKTSYIVVNALPTAPTSVAATQTTICAGANTTLSYTGGSGTTFNWYTGSCGGVSAGTGNNLVVSPATTTTYFGRWENSCGQSVCQSVTITVNPLPVAPTSVAATQTTICSGANTTLSYTGGSGTTFNWYTASCGGTLVGSGNNLIVSPTVTTAYYGRWENTCGNSTCQTVTITVNPLAVVPTSVAATLTTTCAGQTTSLSYTGGSGTTFRWYTGGCGTTLAGAGNNLNVAPTVTTTYYGRWENSCGNSACQTITITVNPLAVAATSASASVPTICEGQSSVLSYVGGSGTTFNWYTASCGGTLVGSGNNFSVSPTATTTYYGRWENSCGNSTCVTTTVTVNPLPVAPTSATATQTTICSGQSTTLSYAGGSGTTFRWYTGACGTTLAGTGNNLNVSPTVTTTYYGRWENTCGNSTCATVTITVNPLAIAPTSVAATQTTICEGQSSVLSYVGGTGTTFRWYTSSCGGTLVGSGNNLSVSPTSTTTYYGAWENSCGLSGCATVTITVNPLPVAPTSASATATTICSGQSTTLSYTGGSGTVFRWYTGSCNGTLVGSGNNLVVSPIVTTTYYGAWENSCGLSGCATVMVTVNPLAVIPTSVSATQTTICSGQSTVLSYVGGSGTTFRWYTASCGGTVAGSGNNLSVSPTTTTTYYGAWENSCGLSACRTITITVNPLPVVATSVSATATTICEGQSSVLSYIGGSGTTFNWYTASCGGTSVGSGNNLSVSPTTTTTYYGRWENTCGNSACQSVTITVNPLPTAATSASASVPTICEGQSSVLSYIGGTGTTFNWYTASCGGTLVGSGNNLSVSPITTTTYYGRWQNACGNSSCVTATVTVNPLPVAATSVSATQTTICAGATTSLSYLGGSGTNFRWYTGACGTTLAGSGNNLNVSPTVTTTYYGRWENSCGNSVCRTITITVNPLPVIATSVSATATTICEGQSTDLTYIGGSGTTFNWYTGSCGGALIGTGNNFTVSPTTTTTYYGAWQNSCGVSTCRTVTITVNPLAVVPTTVSASATTICFGESSTLSYVGGTGATFRWYTGSCGGVLAGSGNNLVVSPTTTTTYYGAWENTCGLSACKTVTVNVTALPAIPIVDIDCTGGENFAVVTVTSPVGAGFEYSLNGGTFQSSPIFVDLANGNYNITVRSNSCTVTGSNFNVNCGCFNPTELTLTSNAGSTCGITPITVLNNTFGGSATVVNVIHNGSGTITSSYVASPFNFTYTPAPADAGNIVQITFTTNNPAGLPCLPAQDVYTLTVNPLSVAPTSVTASNLTVCPGGSTILSYVGGNGTTFKWYTDACNSTFIGAGNNFSVNPMTTTTYYGSWENSCGSSACAQVTVTVTPLPQNVTSVASSQSIICNGESSTLSYVGGSGSVYNWYTASCGGANVGSGNNLVVSPIANTTYYGRWENSCGVSDCEILTITVNQLPVAATSASASISTICEGQSSVLSYVGGSGTTFNWYTASCGGTLAGSGNSLSVSPSTTTTYYGRWENSCGNSACQTVTITVNPLAVAATSVSATQTTICSGANTTLSYTGGSGTTFNWYTASCGGTLVGSGNNLSVSPTVTTTYYGRWENSCGSSACQTVTINVNPLAVAPISANASLTTICAGQTTSLTYTGGSGTTFRWYTGNCGTTLAGTGNNLNVSPTVTTTYYGRWENACGNSACQSVTVTVNPIAVAPTSVSASLSTICNGGNTTLSYVGGSGDTFRWYTGSCGGTLAGTGNDLVVSPSVTTTYYGAWENSCGLTVCESITITVNQLPVPPTSVQASIATICFGGNSVLTYTGGSGTTFNWYTGSCGGSIVGSGNNLIVNPTVTTTYYGRWESSCGLSLCESVTVVVNPLAIAPISVTASPTTVNPTESSVLSFVGGAGTTFNWYTGSCGGTLIGTGNDFSVTPTGTFTYYGAWENSCGVSSCLPVTVSLNALPVAPDAVSATNTTICAGSGTTISYTGGNGSVFKWYTVDCGDTEVGEGNDLFVNPLVTTTYYGRWENAFGNSTCESITITVNPLPVAATLVSVDNSTICAGESIILSYTGGSGDTFRWFENACGTSQVGTGNNLTLSPTVTTTYYGYWENACGISLCESVTVTVNSLPVAAVSVSASDANVCAGSAVTLSYVGGNGAMFRWYANDCGTTLVGEGNDLIVIPTVTTVYYGRWENSCGESVCQQVEVVVNDAPQVPVASFECSTIDELAIITISEPLGIEYTYSIDGVTFQADPVFTNVVDGVYTVYAEMNGCVSNSILTLNINCICNNPATITLPLQEGVVCSNETLYTVGGNTFGGSATELYLTHNGNGIIPVTVITSSPFEFAYTPGVGDAGSVVTITISSNNPEGEPCVIAVATFELTVENAPTIDLPETMPACVDEVFSYALTETYDYVEWSNGSTETTFETTYVLEGEYSVWVIVGNANCEETDEMTVIVDICENVDITDSEQFIGLYPNPANELSNLIIKGYTGEISYVLVDAQGKEIVAKTIGVNSDYSEELNLESLVPGMYFVRVTTDNEVTNLKLIRK